MASLRLLSAQPKTYLRLIGIFLIGVTACSAVNTPVAITSSAGPTAELASAPIGIGAGGSCVELEGDEPPATLTPTDSPEIDPDDWKAFPILPIVSQEMKDVYRAGLENGNDLHAFSILGDCQSEPEVFLGPFDSDPIAMVDLSYSFRETVRNFAGSFDRYSPTVKDGATTGALLWGEWNDNEEGLCEPGETPLDCELRVHRPSIVLVHIGTHWETRNYRYLNMIVEKIIASGAVPVLTLKADNRELDERVNQDVAALAIELGLPVWNFWAVMNDQPNDGLLSDSTWELTPEAQAIHRLAALEMLDAVWRGLR
jgi:hypothetical protein